MDKTDAQQFELVLVTMFRTMGHTEPDKAIVRVWWEACADMDIALFRRACSQYLRTKRYAPTIAAIRDLAGVNKSLWPTPNEAWNMAPKSEWVSAWVFPEMMAALSAAADIMAYGDRIAARMCFIEVYKREIQGKEGAPEWRISDGISTTGERDQQRLELMELHPERLGRDAQKKIERQRGIAGFPYIERSGNGLTLISG